MYFDEEMESNMYINYRERERENGVKCYVIKFGKIV